MRQLIGAALLGWGLFLGLLLGVLALNRESEAVSPWRVSVEMHQIFRQRPGTNQTEPLTDVIFGARYPVWSPDGAWLAFTAADGVYRMRHDGRDLTLLVSSDRLPPPTAMNGTWIVEVEGWSADSQHVFLLMGWQERIDGALLNMDGSYFKADLTGTLETLTERPEVTGQEGLAPAVDMRLRTDILFFVVVCMMVIGARMWFGAIRQTPFRRVVEVAKQEHRQ